MEFEFASRELEAISSLINSRPALFRLALMEMAENSSFDDQIHSRPTINLRGGIAFQFIFGTLADGLCGVPCLRPWHYS